MEADAFLQALTGWTDAIAAHLPETSRTLFRFLCCLEENDREGWIVEANWPDLWKRLALEGEPPALAAALEPLKAAGLVEARVVGRR